MKTHRLRRFPFRIDGAIAKNEAFRQEARRIFNELIDQQIADARSERSRRNPIAKALQDPLFRPRIERDRKRAAKAGYRKHQERFS